MPWEPIHPASRRFRNSSLSFRKCKLRCSCCGNYFGRSHQKAALKYWVGCGEEGKFMLWNGIFFSREEKLVSPTGQKHNVAFGLLPKSLVPTLHAWLCGKKENRVPEVSLSRGIAGSSLWTSLCRVCGTWQILTPAPWGAVHPAVMQTKSRSAGTSCIMFYLLFSSAKDGMKCSRDRISYSDSDIY